MSKKKILITNDDGIEAPGIRYLWDALREVADVSIVAPSEEQSGKGLGITLHKMIHATPVPHFGDTRAWKVEGTPADCVKMGLSVLLNELPELIVSGINNTTNSGRNVLYSGTIGGTIEGAFRGIPGIAFSCVDEENPQYENLKEYIKGIIEYFSMHPIPFGTIINVNFPHGNKKEIKGFKWARQGKSYFGDMPEKVHHPDGRISCKIGSHWNQHDDEHENSDVTLLAKGYITAVPIHVYDLTHHSLFETHGDRFENYYRKLFEDN